LSDHVFFFPVIMVHSHITRRDTLVDTDHNHQVNYKIG